MRFETRTVGVFEVLSVHLEADQAFDAGRLRQETLRLVERGSRRIVLDLGSIDYLYSDSINAFVALNRRMLESSGRLGVLVPHPKVHEILVRAGLENIMRLYCNEADLLGDSRELMRQSSAWTRPAELKSEASASQILSSTALTPRGPDSVRDASASQRIPRRRQGSRVELKSRRRDGRRADFPGDDAPLPPSLPSVGSESSSFRNLVRDSSSFDLKSPPRADRSVPPAPPRPAPPPAAPRAEPTVFELPQDPEQDGYSTDAWLLALTQTPGDASARRSEPEHDSSGFLPKLSEVDSLDSQVTEAEPVSQLDTNLQWEEEISLTDGPLSKAGTSSKRAEPQPPPPPKVAPAASTTPVAKPATPSPAASAEDWMAQMGARSTPAPTPAAPPAAPASRSEAGLGKPAAPAAEPAPSAPAPIPTPAPVKPAPSAGEAWFTAQSFAPTPSAAERPAPTPPVPTTSAESWFGKPAQPASPAPSAPVARTAPVPPAPPASAAENWFGQSVQSPAPAPAPARPNPAPVPPAPPSPESWFGKPQGHSPAATPAENWFAQQPKPVAPPPVAPPRRQEAAPPKPVPVPQAPAANPPSKTSNPSASGDDWFNQPAPRTMVPLRDKPAETDSWFGKPTAEPVKSAPPAEPTRPSAAFGQDLSAEPSAVDWFQAPPPAPKPAPAAPRTAHAPRRKVPEPALLDSDEIETTDRRGSRGGLRLALGLGILLVLVGGGVALWGSRKPAVEGPPVPGATESAPEVKPAESEPPPAPVQEETEKPAVSKSSESRQQAPRKAPASAKPSAAPESKPASAAPPPPPVEDHAPVKVFVTSRPSGAALSFEGTNVGTTPCEIVIRRTGTVTFSLAGYRTMQKTLDPDEVHGSISVQLLSDGGGGATGKIYIESAPQGADIMVGGRSLGKTPRMVELPVGSQKVTVRSGVQSQTRTLTIESGQNPSEKFSL